MKTTKIFRANGVAVMLKMMTMIGRADEADGMMTMMITTGRNGDGHHGVHAVLHKVL